MMNMQPLGAVPMGENTYVIEDNMVRCFLFIGTERALLVDAGFGGEGRSLKELVSTLTDKPVQLVITHADPDHTGFAAEFDAVYMHTGEIGRYAAMGGKNSTRIFPLAVGSAIDIGGRRFEGAARARPYAWEHRPARQRRAHSVAGDSLSAMPVFIA